ncbi:replication protein A 70 kDa DNA-binding subunit B-like [Coffea eugenioides]|uniref:replication protein A 70 kDa DNA-binding subunit B-like n=1 Tax=Coffea eugenioides TaxID=49369 RepID=UPI000F60FE1D|nr:replication protein A 70 kDa DNA-binding subunit B-like [Coffea eugenioides]XP_027174440.1 replication protein A 70 kDa DNA-binding subunit B-like [Coffea eugenioides]
MVNLLCIDDIKPRMKGWSAHVTVEEKIHVATSKHSPTRYQKVVLADSKGSRVEGIMFNTAVEKMGPKFHVFKKYLISNADVREIEEKYQTNGLTIQWLISTRTVVEELDEQATDLLPSQFTAASFKDLPLYADSKSHAVDIMAVVVDSMPVVPIKKDLKESFVQRFLIVNEEMIPTVLSLWNAFVENEGKLITDQSNKHPVILCRRLKVVTYNGISLSTRNDSVVIVDPPIRDARTLKNWACRNEKELLVVSNEKPYTNQSPKMFYGPQHKLSTITDVLPTEKVSWVKCMFSFEHILQKYYYMACVKCRRLTDADYGCTYTCNHCNEKQCRFDIDLTDHTDTITASIFGEQAETLLGFTALQAMDYFNRNEELPLNKLHEELKSKMFIVQLKPGNTKNDGSYQRYTVAYYFEDNAENTSFRCQSPVASKVQNSAPESTASAHLSPEKTESSSKTRRSLLETFSGSEESAAKKKRSK